MARGTTIELSHPEYAVPWEQLGLGLRHWNLDLPWTTLAPADSALLGQRIEDLVDRIPGQ